MLDATDEARIVRAAGGIIVRRIGDDVSLLMIHRSKYDDWSLPKGKALGRESDRECARREVFEETGIDCDATNVLGFVYYIDGLNRRKVCSYWKMVPHMAQAPIAAGTGIDIVEWAPLGCALEAITRPAERELLRLMNASLLHDTVNAPVHVYSEDWVEPSGRTADEAGRVKRL